MPGRANKDVCIQYRSSFHPQRTITLTKIYLDQMEIYYTLPHPKITMRIIQKKKCNAMRHMTRIQKNTFAYIPTHQF